MRISKDRVTFSPTDLANFLACRHTLTLELDAVRGLRTKPTYSDPLADQLRKRGEEHEQRYVASLRAQGLTVEDLTPFKDPKAPMAGKVARSLDAMRRGADVIVQAALGNDTWSGYADVLVKVAGDSALGDVMAVPSGWPLANVFSIGDVLLVVGAAVIMHVQCGSALVRHRAGPPPSSGPMPSDPGRVSSPA